MSRIGTPLRPGAHQSVAYTGTAGTITTASDAQTQVIRVVCTTAGFISIGADPTATTAGIYMPANIPEYFIVAGANKVSAIQLSAGGTLHVTEMG